MMTSNVAGPTVNNVNKTTKKNPFRILSINLETMNKKENDVQQTVDETFPDVICLQETRLKQKSKIKGYQEENFIPTGPKGTGHRGTTILTKTGLVTIPSVKIAENGIELVGCEVAIPGHHSLKIVSSYFSPSLANTFKENQRKAMRTAMNALDPSTPSIGIGDFNAKLALPQHSTTNPLGDVMTELIDENELVAHASKHGRRSCGVRGGRVPHKNLDVGDTI